MSWVKRVPLGDPDYFCDRPPCPFCFVWAVEGSNDRREKKSHPQPRKRHVPYVLAGIALVVTIGITIRHEDLLTWANADVSTQASPPTRDPTPSAPQPIGSHSGSETAASSAALAARSKPIPTTTPVSDPPQTELPVSLIAKTLPDGAQRFVLRNRSTEPLLVTIIVSNTSEQNKYVTQVSIAAADMTTLDGLTTVPGDRIILASAGYRDQVTQVE
ncbi:MAG TPA: hypothetical protein VEK10_06695 [Steroidobacteraceae bacterium]|nr:hypothetical protein [Steroidobacteraceae bacterium]